MSLIVGGVASGIITTGRASATTNRSQRADVLLTSFSEAIKQLPYQPCLPLESAGGSPSYMQMYRDYESKLAAAGEPVLTSSVNPKSTVELTGVKYGDQTTCSPGTEDAGFLVFDLKVTYAGLVRTGQIIKRNPDASPPDGNALLQVSSWSYDGDPEVAFGVTAVGSSMSKPIVLYAYDCDVDDPNSELVLVDTDNNPSAACLYSGTDVPAVGGTPVVKKLSLTVVDGDGAVRTTNECSGSIGPASRQTKIISNSPCRIQIGPRSPQAPEGFTPLVPPIQPPDVTPPDPGSPIPPLGSNKVSNMWFKNNGGCCDTWQKFQFAALPGVTRYRITLVWATGSWATFRKEFTVPAGTQPGSTVTFQFQQFGLSLLEKYQISIEAFVGGSWGPKYFMNNGDPVCLSNSTFQLFGATLCKLG